MVWYGISYYNLLWYGTHYTTLDYTGENTVVREGEIMFSTTAFSKLDGRRQL
jgi:hypothetical protein